MRISRRSLLKGVSGAALISAAGQAPLLGGIFRAGPAAAQDVPSFAPDVGKGRTVAVVGAGIAGLTAAYELLRAGFDVTVFEGQKRYGGRSLTVRPSDADYKSWYLANNPFVTADSYCDFIPAEVRGARVGEQIAQFTPYRVGDGYFDLHLNCGPGRIPTHHTGVLHYCRAFGVPMEQYIFVGDSNLLQSDDLNGGVPVQMREFRYNLDGYVAEMLYGAADGAVPSDIAAKDPSAVDRLRQYLVQFGDLSSNGGFERTDRAGYAIDPGAGTNPGVAREPLALDVLLKASDLWTDLLAGEDYLWQVPLLQPTGGMDMVWQAFLAQVVAGKELRSRVRLEHEVIAMSYAETDGKEVTVTYKAPAGSGQATFDYVVVTAAPFVVERMTLDGLIDDDVPPLLHSLLYSLGGKYGWQARRRFWEDPDVGIFGGTSRTTNLITEIWYPSDGYHGPTGILTGTYIAERDNLVDFDGRVYEPATDYRTAVETSDDPLEKLRGYQWGEMDHATRTKHALEGGALLHPGYEENLYAEDGLSISWNNQPFQYGLDVRHMPATRPEAYARLIQPIDKKGRVFLAGDQVSYLSGWQEGAVRSAWWTLGLIRDDVALQDG